MGEILQIEPNKQEVLSPDNSNKDVEDDYDYARRNLRDLIDSGMGDLDNDGDITVETTESNGQTVTINLVDKLIEQDLNLTNELVNSLNETITNFQTELFTSPSAVQQFRIQE